MPPAIPELDGVEHSFHDLPTGARVHLASAGPEDAPPVLAIHGWPQHWWAWRDVIRELAGEFRLLCPDLRGLGWSGPAADGDYRKQRMADDQLALLDALGLERVRLVGHDWGGWTALLVALAAPERVSSVALMSIGHPWVPTLVSVRYAWKLAYQVPLAAPFAGEEVVRDGRYPRRMLRNGRRDGRRWTREEEDAYVDVLREPSVARASSKLYRDFLLRDLPASLGLARRRFEMPARLVIGSREPFREFAAGFRGEVDVIEGAGHFLPEEAPAAVAERIRAM
jgi:pimeloyl-ACP methyl ester carboxylesterase